MGPSTSQPVTSAANSSQGNGLFVLLHHSTHGSVTRFTGSSGVAIVTRSDAYLVTDSRYWIQAETQMDKNWQVIKAGNLYDSDRRSGSKALKDWVDFLLVCVICLIRGCVFKPVTVVINQKPTNRNRCPNDFS